MDKQTKRKQEAEPLRRMSTVVKDSNDAITIQDFEGRITAWNHGAERMYGYSEEEALLMNIGSLTAPGKVEEQDVFTRRLMAGEAISAFETQRVTKDGRVLDVWLTVTKLMDDAGKSIGLASTERDITARKREEESIRKLNRVYTMLGSISRAIVRIREPQALFQEVCRIAVEEGGFRMAWFGLADPAKRRVLPAAHAGVMDGYLEKLDMALGDEARGRGPTGNAVSTGKHRVCNDIENDPDMAPWREDALRNGYRASATFPLKGSGGEVRGVFGLYAAEPDFFDDSELKLLDELAMDIGFDMEVAEREIERKKAEEAVRESETRYRMLFEDAQDGMALADAETGRLVDCNQTLCRIVERKREELVGQSQSILHPPVENTEGLSKTFRQHRAGDAGQVLGDGLLSKSGKLIPVEIRAARIRINDRDCLLAVFRDITARKEAEEERERLQTQLLQAHKLEAIGTLAGGVAHEINNPIMGIMNYAQLIEDRLGPDSPVAEFAAEIGRETKRVAAIVKNLLSFARVERQHHSPARPCDIVKDTLSLIQTVLRHDQIALEVDVPEDLPEIKCRSQQIQQVIMNLLTNARDALNERYPGYDENKKILLTVRPMEKAGARWVRMTVEDRGPGIPEALRGQIFDPFFSTKSRDKGTGLGLSISHGIVRDHAGELSVESTVGEFTRFHLDLPVNNGWKVGKAEAGSGDEEDGEEAGEKKVWEYGGEGVRERRVNHGAYFDCG